MAAARSGSGCKATGTLAQVPSSVNASQRRTTPTMDRRHYTATLGTREREKCQSVPTLIGSLVSVRFFLVPSVTTFLRNSLFSPAHFLPNS